MPGLWRAAGAVEVGAHTDHGSKGVGGFPLGGVEHARDVTVAVPRTRIGPVIAAKNIGGQCAHLFASAAALSGFVLSRIVVEQVVVGCGH